MRWPAGCGAPRHRHSFHERRGDRDSPTTGVNRLQGHPQGHGLVNEPDRACSQGPTRERGVESASHLVARLGRHQSRRPLWLVGCGFASLVRLAGRPAAGAPDRMPVIHALRAAAVEGGLISYGVDLPNLFRQAAIYADSILKGTDPADLPIYLPTKFELIINLTTAKTLGIDVPMSLMLRADEMVD
jgi:hypothetical protein